ncbi:uncharacterized protein LOC113202290 isoform X1 [Frankliniella occidentalis]|uniref:Uncharacterized protein LOC113202290 isoform X1 n=1 Tax=Frankliniella occidentalis TaxID=133901 RepID=A0A6J1RV36_FRAOC|nr:uncharacterized protein LOC113202290 isoform X1 [Frankliniella occidentalis]
MSTTASRVAAALTCAACLLQVWAVPAGTTPQPENAVAPCQLNSTDLNQCIARNIEHFLQTAKHGLSEVGIDALDPLAVKELELIKGKGKVAVTFEFHDVRFKGFSNSEVNSARMNVNDKKLEVSLRAPVYEIDGQYTCSGGVYELPISSNGHFAVTLTDVTSAWMLYFLTKTTNNETQVAVNRFIVDVSPSNVVYRFDKKFDGENSLGIGEAMDEFMNENALEIYNDIKPQLMSMLSELFLERANQVLINFPGALPFIE